MDRSTDVAGHSPSSAPADPAGRLPVRPAATSLAGLIDVLDRVDGPAGAHGRRRFPAHRSASGATGSRTTGFRATASRGTPLRSVQPAPMARRPAAAPVVQTGYARDISSESFPAVPVDGVRKPPPAPAGRAGLIRRAAMWGAGPDGAYLAWRAATARPAPAQPPPEAVPRAPRLRTLVRRLALWGAGDKGANLAWGAPVAPGAARKLDPPVVLREMPSTPLIQPAASSPAAALVTAAPAPVGRRPIGPVLPRVAPIEPVGWCAPADSTSSAPSGWPAPPTGWPQPPEWPPAKPAARRSTPSGWPAPPTGWPQPPEWPPAKPAARPSFSFPRERGLARPRGDPLSSPARGSPPAPRRTTPSTPSASIWSPAPASLPPPCPAQAAPG